MNSTYRLALFGFVMNVLTFVGCGKDSAETSASDLTGAIGSTDMQALYYYGRIYVKSNFDLQSGEIRHNGKSLTIGSYLPSNGGRPIYYSSNITPADGDLVDLKATVRNSSAEKSLRLVFSQGSSGLELKIRPDTVDPVQPADPITPVTPLTPVTPIGNLRTGDIDSKYAASNGLESRYRMHVPTDYAQVQRGLLVYLHGDLHLELYGNYFFNQMKTLASKHNLIPIAVYAPGSTQRWWNDGSRNADVLQELLSKVKADYKTTNDRVFFYSMSGGSLFNSAYFIPRYGSNYKGAAAFMCGGAKVETASVSPTQMSRNMKMLFYTHPTDFLYQSAMESFRYYQSIGVNAKFEVPSYGGHCVLQPNDKMDAMLGEWQH